MPGERVSACSCCGARIETQVPEYYIELECFRLLNQQGREIPRRGSREYHEAMDRLLPEIQEAYFRNREMYDNGHLWCPTCGSRLTHERTSETNDFGRDTRL